MLSKLVNSTAKNYSRLSLRHASTVVASRRLAGYKKSLIFFGGFGSLTCYDYFFRESETLGAARRFARSFKIAFQVSLDYNIGLRGLVEDTAEYDKVRLNQR